MHFFVPLLSVTIGITKKTTSMTTLMRLDAIMKEYSNLRVLIDFQFLKLMSVRACRYIFSDSARQTFEMTESSIRIQRLICAYNEILSVKAYILTRISPAACAMTRTTEQKLRQLIQLRCHLLSRLIYTAFIMPLQQNRQMVRKMVCTMNPGRISKRTQLREYQQTKCYEFLSSRKYINTLQTCWLHRIMHQATTRRQIIIIFLPCSPSRRVCFRRCTVTLPMRISMSTNAARKMLSPSLLASQQQNYPIQILYNAKRAIDHQRCPIRLLRLLGL